MKKLFLICLACGIVLGIALFAMSQSSVVTGAGSSSSLADNGSTLTYSGAGGIVSSGTAGGCSGVYYGFAGAAAGTGIALDGTTRVDLCANNNLRVTVNTQGLEVGSSGGLTRSSTGSSNGTFDTAVSFPATGTVSFDTSTIGNGLGNAKANEYTTTANCAAVGTAAQPSVAACAAASSGSFSCATAATSSCQVNTTIVTANSQILVQQTANTAVGTRLSVTCNTAASTLLPMVTSQVAATSFTIQLTQPVTNPDCFYYTIVN